LTPYARICGVERGAADPVPVHPDELIIPDAHQRKRLVQFAAVAVLHAQLIRPDAYDYLKALSQQLATHDSVIGAVIEGRHLKTRVLSMRRGMRA
jgi:hypothetical protein